MTGHPIPRAVLVASIDHRCEGLIPGRELHVLSLGQDPYGPCIEYEITPALPMGPPFLISWCWSARDDTGQHYEMAGGAYGPSDNGEVTRGVLSLTPLLNPDARSLRILLNPSLLPTWEERTCSFDIDLSDRAR
jgi:hypothetical protein